MPTHSRAKPPGDAYALLKNTDVLVKTQEIQPGEDPMPRDSVASYSLVTTAGRKARACAQQPTIR